VFRFNLPNVSKQYEKLSTSIKKTSNLMIYMINCETHTDTAYHTILENIETYYNALRCGHACRIQTFATKQLTILYYEKTET